MEGINQFIDFLKLNYPNIIVIVAIILTVFNEIRKYIPMSKEERIDAALRIIKAEILKMMSDAEIEWADYKKSGMLKKSQVINEIYDKFPVLADCVDQEMLICKIEEIIDNEMNNMNSIINKSI